MYLLDPERGRSRRAYLRGKAVRAEHRAERALHYTLKNAQNRVRGVVAECVRSIAEDQVTDEVLEERTRAKIGHAVTNAHPILVSAADGQITLEGSVPADELDGLLRTVSDVRGVKSVENRLQLVDPVGVREGACCVPAAQWKRYGVTAAVGLLTCAVVYLVNRSRETVELSVDPAEIKTPTDTHEGPHADLAVAEPSETEPETAKAA